MTEQTLDALVPDLPCDHDLEDTITSFHKACKRSAANVWIKTFSIRGACRCCTYVRTRLLLARDKFVMKHGKIPARNEEPEQLRCYRELKRAVRLYAASRIQSAARGMLSRSLPPTYCLLTHSVHHRIGAATPRSPSAKRRTRPIDPNAAVGGGAPALEQMLKQIALERQLAGDGLPTTESPAEQLQREKRRLKSALREHAATVQADPMALEAIRPVYALYHQIKKQLGELSDANAGAELVSPEQIAERRIQELSSEASELRARLQKYEDAFFAAKGRKMKCKKEIAPVAEEYKRFKEIKDMLEELNASASA